MAIYISFKMRFSLRNPYKHQKCPQFNPLLSCKRYPFNKVIIPFLRVETLRVTKNHAKHQWCNCLLACMRSSKIHQNLCDDLSNVSFCLTKMSFFFKYNYRKTNLWQSCWFSSSKWVAKISGLVINKHLQSLTMSIILNGGWKGQKQSPAGIL